MKLWKEKKTPNKLMLYLISLAVPPLLWEGGQMPLALCWWSSRGGTEVSSASGVQPTHLPLQMYCSKMAQSWILGTWWGWHRGWGDGLGWWPASLAPGWRISQIHNCLIWHVFLLLPYLIYEGHNPTKVKQYRIPCIEELHNTHDDSPLNPIPYQGGKCCIGWWQ